VTTSEGAGTPIWQSLANEQASGGELSPQATANADRPEATPLTGRIAAPPDDPQQLQAEIERTREQLGDTVQELAARVNVKSRARARAAKVSGRVTSTTTQARRNAAARAGNVRSQVSSKTVAARQKVISAGGARKDELRKRAAAVGTPVWEATPEPMRRAVTQGGDTAREYWMPLALAAGSLIFGYLAVRR
jgi:hypothetical protein